MMTIQPSRLTTMKTITACEQALHLMHQSNPTVPTEYQGQRQTGGQTGSSIQDQMLRLPGFLN